MRTMATRLLGALPVLVAGVALSPAASAQAISFSTDYPRTLVFIQEDGIGQVASREMTTFLRNAGFPVIDPALAHEQAQRELVRAALDGDEGAATELGRDFGAQVLILGQADWGARPDPVDGTLITGTTEVSVRAVSLAETPPVPTSWLKRGAIVLAVVVAIALVVGIVSLFVGGSDDKKHDPKEPPTEQKDPSKDLPKDSPKPKPIPGAKPAQPEPVTVVATASSCARNGSKPPKSRSIASASAPFGRPPPSGTRLFQYRLCSTCPDTWKASLRSSAVMPRKMPSST